jgi:hypothetical protein
LFFCWHRPVPVARQFGEYDWPGFRNPFGKLVPAPLVLTPRPDGTLQCASYPGWDEYRKAAPAPVVTEAPNGWQIETAPGGMQTVASAQSASDFLMEGTLTLSAATGGLAFRLDDDEGGYTVTLTPGSDSVILAKSFGTTRADDGRPWFRYQELQRGVLHEPVAAGRPIPFRLLVAGPYIECSFDGEVVIATASHERQAGRVGMWAESGRARIEDARWSPLRCPEHR